MPNNIFLKSLIVAAVTFILDFLFHFFLTRPMETLTYFVIKFLLAFFAASAMFSLNIFYKNLRTRKWIIPAAGLIFSALMSVYYRAWELGEAYVPFGSRAPDIFGINRGTIFFSLVWWLGHALFFAVGAIISIKLTESLKKK